MKKIDIRVKNLIKRFKTRNPEYIAKALGIHIEYTPYEGSTKGYYIRTLRQKFIVVNSNLNEFSRKIVLAHELGHAVLHSSKEIHFIRENTLFPRGIVENEANKFAAELLIDETEIDYNMLNNLSIDQLSAYLEVPIDLLFFKFNSKG